MFTDEQIAALESIVDGSGFYLDVSPAIDSCVWHYMNHWLGSILPQ